MINLKSQEHQRTRNGGGTCEQHQTSETDDFI